MESNYKPNFDQLKDLLLVLSRQRTELDVMTTMVKTLVETRPHQARVCVWKMESGRLRMKANARAAELRNRAEWKDSRGSYLDLPSDHPLFQPILDSRRIAVARTPEEWAEYPNWAREEGIVAYGLAPIHFHDSLFGVMGVFLRYQFNDDEAWQNGVAWTQVFADHLGAMIANAQAFEEVQRLQHQLELENEYLREQEAQLTGFGDVVGKSPAILKAFDQVRLVAPTDASVLLLGESGTGKELFAKLLHEHSKRAKGPLIKVNCAAIPRELFESEFFGHVKGSFTGAIKDRVGRFQLADGGTIFLDEIGEIPTDLQSKLLRVLQEGVFERIGEERSRQTNVRIVAATNRDLTEEIAAKRFREDLYYRLSVFPIRLPPLRERADDIPLIAEHFLIQSAKRFGRKPLAMNRSHVEQLKSYRWPGNVRELQHVIERSVIISERGSLQIALDANPSLQATSSSDGVDPPSEDRVLTYRDLEDLEKRNIELALKQCGGRVSGASGAAKLLELNPSTLTSRIKSLKIRIARPTDDQTQA